MVLMRPSTCRLVMYDCQSHNSTIDVGSDLIILRLTWDPTIHHLFPLESSVHQSHSFLLSRWDLTIHLLLSFEANVRQPHSFLQSMCHVTIPPFSLLGPMYVSLVVFSKFSPTDVRFDNSLLLSAFTDRCGI